MTGHTPGPWRMVTDDCQNVTIQDKNGRRIAEPSYRDFPLGEASDQEVAANAKLIAAAPDLWAALEQIARLTLDGEQDDTGEVFEMSIDDAFSTVHEVIMLARQVCQEVAGT